MSDRYEIMQLALLGLIAAGVTDARWLRILLYIWVGCMGTLTSGINVAHFVEAMK